MELAIALAIVEAVGKYGVPAVQAGLEAYKKETITLQDVENLHLLVKKPEDYFNKK